MRDVIDKAMNEAREVVDKTVSGIEADHKLTDNEMVERYVKLHRGNPLSMAQFVVQRAPKGANMLTQMREYEAAMEALLKSRGVR